MKFSSPLFSVNNKKFNLIILAAGIGTRLRPETDYIPKALLELGGLRAIDHLMRKYQYLAGKIIIAVGYSADLLENYVRGRYASLNLFFSREDVSNLKGPGESLVYALDFASSKIPTIITFCDYIVEDQFSVDNDCIGVCKPGSSNFVFDTYKTVVVAEDGIVMDLVENEDLENNKENGFTGIGVFQDTKFLKSIVYSKAVIKRAQDNVDYTMDIVRTYIQKVR
ncbi:MAG: NTP transferase domain-containing protein, partial [Desulfobacterales bacterium]|nr:NTP transferase domain-containing protein [Desulfobacterales bacterium]